MGKAVGTAYHDLAPKLSALYKKASKVAPAPSTNRTKKLVMTLYEWANFLKSSNAYDLYPGFKRDDTAYAFRLGLETRSDEQFSESFQEMSLIEFSRAIAAMLFI